MEPLIGKPMDRVDGRLKVTGRATYSAELPVANIAYAVIVSASPGKGRLTSIDTAAAERPAGVLAVLTHRNAPRLPGASKKMPSGDRVWQILQNDEIHYDDQPIAVVVADTLERAQYAGSLVRANILPAIPSINLERALDDLVVPTDVAGGDNADETRGDVERALAGASVTVAATYVTPTQFHQPMEPHATIAIWYGDDKVTVYEPTQGITRVQRKVATVFGLAPANVRVISYFVGGGFGCKGSAWSHVGLAVLAARVTKRAVKLVLTRPQMTALVGHRPPTIQRVSLGADAAGNLVAIRHAVVSHTARFDEFIAGSAVMTRMLYECANVATTHRLVRLDVSMPTFMRAPGESTGTFALESAMDELAYALKVDPLELRLRNYAERDPATGRPWSSKELRACYEQASKRFGWAARATEPRSVRDDQHLVGVGMATAVYPAYQDTSSAAVRLRQDGSALVQAGTQEIGTGTYTIMTQIAAETLGIPFERVRFELGDTNLPETPSSGGSRTASSTGSAVMKACLAARDRLIELAIADSRSPLHGAPPSEVTVVNGALISTHSGASPDQVGDVVRRTGQPELVVTVESRPKAERKSYSCHAFGAHFVEVRVDEETGEVRVSRVVSAFAAGRILNAKTARSQLIGGIVWGIGFALEEIGVRDPRTGRVVTRDLADYHVPVHADVLSIDVIVVNEHDEHVNEIGAKGVGEIGNTGISAAIANAVFHATGKRIRSLPIALDKLL